MSVFLVHFHHVYSTTMVMDTMDDIFFKVILQKKKNPTLHQILQTPFLSPVGTSHNAVTPYSPPSLSCTTLYNPSV